eukprot:m.24813 g.24813  ORF g.24813 m.24813 type:complete len:151 (-) comp13465_c0_seq1:2243-2695(-)
MTSKEITEVLADKKALESKGDLSDVEKQLLRALKLVETLSDKNDELQHAVDEHKDFANELVKGVRKGEARSDGIKDQLQDLQHEISEKDDHAESLVAGLRAEKDRSANFQEQIRELQHQLDEQKEFIETLVAETRKTHAEKQEQKGTSGC